jgi:hypothetical protein
MKYRRAMIFASPVLVLISAYLVIRAIVEPFLLNWHDPASYRDSWGGPSYLGVLAVHSGPGLLIVVIAIIWLVRRRHADARPS